MLKELHIKNVVLIKEVKVAFNKGFSVVTGETGAGKSILLDSLSMALGERANYSMIGDYGDFAEITAIFHLKDHPAIIILQDNFIDVSSEEIIIRRIITKDNKTKILINDTSVTVSFLRKIGEILIDIHGQFDNHKLLNSSFHRDILDMFLDDNSLIKTVKDNYIAYKTSYNNFYNQKQAIENLIAEREYIEYSIAELEELAPQPLEEKNLLEQKQIISSSQRITDNIDAIKKYINNSNINSAIYKALKQIDSLRKLLPEHVEVGNIAKDIEEAYSKLESANLELESLENSFGFEDINIKDIETRLMELRTIAKKHKVLPEQLAELIITLKEKLNIINSSEHQIEELELDLKQKQAEFYQNAEKLSALRKETAKALSENVNIELNYLKLNNANFNIEIESCDESENGLDKAVFKVKTNNNSKWGDLQKVASGGEMARFMLAIKSVLAKKDIITTMILDEIDIGVGGEVALAIGNRLLHLSQFIQLIVVTHSHQVASRGEHHYKVVKSLDNNDIITKLLVLNHNQRKEEIARMISGDTINNEALATATSLLGK